MLRKEVVKRVFDRYKFVKMKRSSTGHRSSASINASNHHERRSKHRSIPS